MNGTSSFSKQVSRQIRKLASAKDILITGEPGTGKRTLARAIHQRRTTTEAFILLDGRAITHADIQAVLFDKNRELAFLITGQHPARLSNHSTLCIANVDALGPHDQDLVATFLEKHRKDHTGLHVVFTVSDMAKVAIEVRGIERIEVPGLRNRLQDLPDLVKSILQSLGRESLTAEHHLINVLKKSSWPGNIRELVRVVEKGALMSKGNELELPDDYLNEHQHLQNAIERIGALENFTLDDTLWFIEKLLIERLLNGTKHNQSMAAEVLNLTEANFRYRLKKFGIASVRARN